MAATAERQELQVIERHPAPAPMVAGVGEFSAMAMIAQAVERGAAPEMIDKLFDWQDRIEKKQAVRDFDAAFAMAKGAFPKITKDTNVYFKSKNGGGWNSRNEMVRKRLADFKAYARPISVCEVEHGFRTDEPCSGPLKGLTRVEVVEFIAA